MANYHLLFLIVPDKSGNKIILRKKDYKVLSNNKESRKLSRSHIKTLFLPFVHSQNSSLCLPTKDECELIKKEYGITGSWKCCLSSYIKVYNFTGQLQMIKCILSHPIEVDTATMTHYCLQWFSLTQISDAFTNGDVFSLGKEIHDISQLLLKQNDLNSISPTPTVTVVSYHSDTAISPEPTTSEFTTHSLLTDPRQLFFDVTSDFFTQRDRQDLYDEYLTASSPSYTLGMPQFIRSMQDAGFPSRFVLKFFRLWDTKKLGYLTFCQFLLATACIDPAVPHCGKMAEIRCRIIFRFYDVDKDEKLNREELKDLLQDIHRARKHDKANIQTINEFCESILKSHSTNSELGITEMEFLRAVGSLSLRGTSNLLRAKTSLIEKLRLHQPIAEVGGVEIQPRPVLSTSMESDPNGTFEVFEVGGGIMDDTNVVDDDEDYSPTAVKRSRCQHPQLHYRYEVALHTVRVRRGGEVTNVSTIWDMPATAVSQSAESNLLAGKARIDRLLSIDCFNQKSHANEMVNGLRFFERSITLSEFNKPSFSWGPVDRRGLASCLLSLCDIVAPLFKHENRLLRLSSPCYILGDIHGNYPCLMSFEKALWRLGPNLMPAQFLFLGDYVDRGAHGVETVAYLFALKVQCPHKIHLLRGNHEIGTIQENFTFKQECISKFGQQVGTQIWEKVNYCFDCMPLAAVIDDQVFCVHGGIPRPSLLPSLDSINDTIPCPLSHVTQESCPLAWELMWSDPLRHDPPKNDDKISLPLAPPPPPPLATSTNTSSTTHPLVNQQQQQDTKSSASEEAADGVDVISSSSTSTTSSTKQGDEEFAPNVRRGTACYFSAKALRDFLTRHQLSHVIRAHEIKLDGFQVQQNARLLTVFSSSRYCNYNNEAACILADQGKLRVIRLDTS